MAVSRRIALRITVLRGASLIPRCEPEGVEIGVLHDETEADRPAGERRYVRAALPAGRAFDLVANQLRGVRERVARERGSGCVLDLHPNAARRGGRIVQPQAAAREAEWSSRHLPSGVGGLDRGEPIEAKGA